MKLKNMDQIRERFLDFFDQHDHNRLKSFSLVPRGDKSLLLINAGMAPLKDYFMGRKAMNPNRATTSQRCIRTQDLENVGKTARHGTFFEMLGNFSFGDYFKREAIHWAYEFLTEEIGLEPEKLYVTVFKEDDEAYDIWVDEIGIPEDRMYRLGKEDNFWELGLGPCGPCSEIHYDRGEEYGEGTGPLDNSDRFMEIWNLVFPQYDKQEDGTYEDMEHPSIDTGMGLERIACIVEGVDNIFDVSAFRPIRDEIEKISHTKYGESDKADVSIRVILDHAKAMTFLVYDGVVPSNEGRGYVLRRLIRRAIRHGKLLGVSDKFLEPIIDRVIEAYSTEYSELQDSRDRIQQIISKEEDNFQKTLDSGLDLLDQTIEELEKNGKKEIDGKSAFRLYDTYGFPLDLTIEIAEEHGMTVDEAGFQENMENQKNLSRERRNTGDGWVEDKDLDLSGIEETEFTGYDHVEDQGQILAIFKDDQRVDQLLEGESGILVLDRTCFYGEGGGQVGDTGRIETNEAKARVEDTSKNSSNIFFHHVIVEQGDISQADQVETLIDVERRNDIRRNHSATHLLQKALKTVLGDHVEQAGSYVDDRRLRFDFSHFEAMTKDQIEEVEILVNQAIFAAYPVNAEVMTLNEATEEGAIGLFEDKYTDRVRVVSMGDYSKELCGGTHIDNTAKIQMFRIISEQGVSAGVRRIEATTGRNCYRQLVEYEDRIHSIAQELKARPENIEQKITSLLNEEKELRRQIDSYQSRLAGELSHELENQITEVEGISLLTSNLGQKSMDELKELIDQLKEGKKNLVIVLAGENEGKVLLAASVDDALTKQGIHAGQIIKEVAQKTGGNGGGRPNFATAGGKDVDKIDEALALVPDWIKAHLK